MMLCAAMTKPVMAHTDEYMDTISGAHGGQLRMAGGSHFEMVVKPDTLQIFVTDHAGNVTPVAGASGSATVLSGSTSQKITLIPKGDNLLEGPGTFAPGQATKAVVKIQLSGEEAQQVMFDSSKHKPVDPHSGHH
jgi:hypothetical protein